MKLWKIRIIAWNRVLASHNLDKFTVCEFMDKLYIFYHRKFYMYKMWFALEQLTSSIMHTTHFILWVLHLTIKKQLLRINSSFQPVNFTPVCILYQFLPGSAGQQVHGRIRGGGGLLPLPQKTM